MYICCLTFWPIPEMSNRVSERKREIKITLIPLFSGRLVSFHTRPSLVPCRLGCTPSCESAVWELLRGAAGLFFQLVACDSCLYCALLSLCVCVCLWRGYKWSLLSPSCQGKGSGQLLWLPSFSSFLHHLFFPGEECGPSEGRGREQWGIVGCADVCLCVCVF